jgi:(hydroxyamino)benzene mutase
MSDDQRYTAPYPFRYEVNSLGKDQFIKAIQENVLSRQGHRLLQVGVALFLFASLEGFAIPYLAAPRLGLSVHTLSALQGVLLLALGLTWPRLNLGATTSQIAFWLLIYSAFAILAAYVMAAAWGAGNEQCGLRRALLMGAPFKRLSLNTWRIRLHRRVSPPSRSFFGAFALPTLIDRAASGNGCAVV